MTDIVDAATRSRMMSGIRGENTKPELYVRSLLHRRGFRFRLHVRNLPGKPDIVLPRYRAVIFVHGCFWHGHDCKRGSLPKSNVEFWEKKLQRNVSRDAQVMTQLRSLGWEPLVVWECQLKDIILVTQRLARFLGPTRLTKRSSQKPH